MIESPQATVGQITEPVAHCPLSAIGEAPTGRSDRVAHETRRCSREVGYCEECREPCEAAVVDFGIGPYEYWGRKCYDTNKQIVSKCCEATIFEDADMTIEYTPGD